METKVDYATGEVLTIDDTPADIVIASDGSVRDKAGKFVKGNALKPHNPGRPRKLDPKAILDAIDESFPPEQIVKMMKQSYEVAFKQDDAKAMMMVVQFATYYLIGKPVQRSITAQITPDEFRNMFKTQPQDEGEVIDAEQ